MNHVIKNFQLGYDINPLAYILISPYGSVLTPQRETIKLTSKAENHIKKKSYKTEIDCMH